MGIITVGAVASGHAVFDRVFFSGTLPAMIEETGVQPGAYVLTLFLSDGQTVNVCAIEALHDTYMAIRVFRPDEEVCDTTLSLIPYGLIYRVDLAPKRADQDERVGFHWAAKKKRSSK